MRGARLSSVLVLTGMLAVGCQEHGHRDEVADSGAAAVPGAGPFDGSSPASMDAHGGEGDLEAGRFDAAQSEGGTELPDSEAGSAWDAASALDADGRNPPDARPSSSDAALEGAAPDYMLGAAWVQADEARGATYSDGRTRDVLELLRSHGFNYVRLRMFVDPKAADGYDRQDGFADLAHTIAFGRRVKAAGMGFLLDLHYSDNWADPGKQCVPVAWQKHTSIQPLAAALHDYTHDAIAQLAAAGARPDVVQLGNEITPGMLLHVCDAGGQPLHDNPVQGRSSNWTNLGALLRAGVSGVREVDPGIGIMLHIDRCGDKGGYTGDALETSTRFITEARAHGVAFEYFAESCYQAYQGDPTRVAETKLNWSKTLSALAERFPELRFVAAEYGPMQREINDVVFGLPQRRGAGTFVWEPTREGDWNRGHTLFTPTGLEYEATADLALYDAMRAAYAARL